MHPATRYVTKMDSTTSLLRALALFLRGRDFPALGIAPHIPGSVAEAVNLLPAPVRASLYRWTGWFGGASETDLPQVRTEEISDWELAAMSDPRNWVRPAVALAAGGAAAGALVVLGLRHRHRQDDSTAAVKALTDAIGEAAEGAREEIVRAARDFTS